MIKTKKNKKEKKILTADGRIIIIQVRPVRCSQCNKMFGYFKLGYLEIICDRCDTTNEIISI